jgi:two-component system sensor histidine kinase ChiS
MAQKGMFDLRNWDFQKNGNAKLNGQWEFYWEKLYNPVDFENKTTEEPDYIKITGLWDKSLNEKYARTGYATYRLKIDANCEDQFLSLYLKIAAYSSSKIFVNAKYVGGNGVVATKKEDGISSYTIKIKPFYLKNGKNEIIIQLSNFEINRRGGFLFVPQLGQFHNIVNTETQNLIINLMIIGGILIFIIYHFILFIVWPNNRSALYFALFNLFLFMYFISQYAMQYFIADYDIIRNIRNFGWIMSIPTFILLLKSIFPEEINKNLLKIVIGLSIVSYIAYLLKIERTFDFFQTITILTGLYIILIAVLAYIRKRENAKIFLISMTFVALSGINDAMLYLGLIESIRLTQFGLFLFLLIQSYILSARFSVAYKRNKVMSGQLAYINKNLESLVLNRTKKIEEQNVQLEELIATKDRFFSIIAHDLRGPIGNLATSLGLLTDEYEKLNEETKYGLLSDLKKSSDKTYQLLENLLVWAQVQRNSIRYQPDNIALYELVAENIELVKMNAKNKQIDISANIAKTIKIYADNDMVDTILRNLLNNAIKFTPNNGRITVRANTDNNKVRISVSDTGVGIKEENLAKLFRIEHNYYAVGTNGEKGTGLGLILCKELIKKHEGDIVVESECGKGTTFMFSLPNAINN